MRRGPGGRAPRRWTWTTNPELDPTPYLPQPFSLALTLFGVYSYSYPNPKLQPGGPGGDAEARG